MTYFVAKDQKQLGPFSLEEINAKLGGGLIVGTDLAWTDGWTGWQPLSSIPGVTLPSVPPPIPPRVPEKSQRIPQAVTIVRQKEWASYLRRMTILIEGEEMGILRAGEAMTLELKPGTYLIQISIGRLFKMTASKQICIRPKQENLFRVGCGSGASDLLLLLLLGPLALVFRAADKYLYIDEV